MATTKVNFQFLFIIVANAGLAEPDSQQAFQADFSFSMHFLVDYFR